MIAIVASQYTYNPLLRWFIVISRMVVLKPFPCDIGHNRISNVTVSSSTTTMSIVDLIGYTILATTNERIEVRM
jgi:hypothetical protein